MVPQLMFTAINSLKATTPRNRAKSLPYVIICKPTGCIGRHKKPPTIQKDHATSKALTTKRGNTPTHSPFLPANRLNPSPESKPPIFAAATSSRDPQTMVLAYAVLAHVPTRPV